jgi:hypothetical protein
MFFVLAFFNKNMFKLSIRRKLTGKGFVTPQKRDPGLCTTQQLILANGVARV